MDRDTNTVFFCVEAEITIFINSPADDIRTFIARLLVWSSDYAVLMCNVAAR